MNDLAIVIPAYKGRFFRETLGSIAAQTCKEFTLYIGDDCSPEKLEPIVDEFRGDIPIIYYRFDSNLGGSNLVDHWTRCIDLSREEKWIWLFSDDDLMDRECVERFYKCQDEHPGTDLMHFNVKIIDANSKVVRIAEPFPEKLTVKSFFMGRLKGTLDSYAVEYIFKRTVYLKKGGFQLFDLAWNSDDATWMKFANPKYILTLDGATVSWRYSQSNISSIFSDDSIVNRKVNASIEFLKWVGDFLNDLELVVELSEWQKFKMKILSIIGLSSLGFVVKYQLARRAIEDLGYSNLKPRSFIFLCYMEFKRRIFSKVS